ncbi:hypothetical protein Tco_0847245 [Tanacetum coccineum]
MGAADFAPLIEKIELQISTWTARQLSFAGRLQLVSSVIFSLTNFWIAAFRLPKSCINKIDKLCASFLWSGPDLKTTKAKVYWKVVCTLNEEVLIEGNMANPSWLLPRLGLSSRLVVPFVRNRGRHRNICSSIVYTQGKFGKLWWGTWANILNQISRDARVDMRLFIVSAPMRNGDDMFLGDAPIIVLRE